MGAHNFFAVSKKVNANTEGFASKLSPDDARVSQVEFYSTRKGRHRRCVPAAYPMANAHKTPRKNTLVFLSFTMLYMNKTSVTKSTSLTIDFDELGSSPDFRNGLLTDVSENPRDRPVGGLPSDRPVCDYTFIKTQRLWTNGEFVPFACNFNLPIEHHKNITTMKFSEKTGRNTTKVVKSFTRNLDKSYQWSTLVGLIEKWIDRIAKVGFIIPSYEIYGEFTSNGMIHAHGIVDVICSEAYAIGVGTILGAQWIKLTKGSMVSLAKKNLTGKFDYAFAKCNNLNNFLAYAKKGPGLTAKSAEENELSLNQYLALSHLDKSEYQRKHHDKIEHDDYFNNY